MGHQVNKKGAERKSWPSCLVAVAKVIMVVSAVYGFFGVMLHLSIAERQAQRMYDHHEISTHSQSQPIQAQKLLSILSIAKMSILGFPLLAVVLRMAKAATTIAMLVVIIAIEVVTSSICGIIINSVV